MEERCEEGNARVDLRYCAYQCGLSKKLLPVSSICMLKSIADTFIKIGKYIRGFLQQPWGFLFNKWNSLWKNCANKFSIRHSIADTLPVHSFSSSVSTLRNRLPARVLVDAMGVMSIGNSRSLNPPSVTIGPQVSKNIVLILMRLNNVDT